MKFLNKNVHSAMFMGKVDLSCKLRDKARKTPLSMEP